LPKFDLGTFVNRAPGLYIDVVLEKAAKPVHR